MVLKYLRFFEVRRSHVGCRSSLCPNRTLPLLGNVLVFLRGLLPGRTSSLPWSRYGTAAGVRCGGANFFVVMATIAFAMISGVAR
jgi:hypothetical protein